MRNGLWAVPQTWGKPTKTTMPAVLFMPQKKRQDQALRAVWNISRYPCLSQQ